MLKYVRDLKKEDKSEVTLCFQIINPYFYMQKFMHVIIYHIISQRVKWYFRKIN